jgi:excisionase family DNA binding protein
MRDISVRAAARRYGLCPVKLKAAVDDGRIRHISRRKTARRVWITVSQEELIEDVARLPRCVADGCGAPTLRADGYCERHAEDLVTLTTVARQHGLDPKALKRGIDAGQIRCEDPGMTRILLRETELIDDLARLPICCEDGCNSQVLLGSARCHEHYNLPGRRRARRRHEDLLASEREWFSGAEVARLVGVSLSTVSRDVRTGVLPGELLGRYMRIPRAALRAYRTANLRRPKRYRPTRRELAERRQLAGDLAQEGVDVDEIAKRIGCVRSAACNYLDAAGVDRPRRRSARKLSPEERRELAQRARALREQGRTPAEIAGELGLSRTSVNVLLAWQTPDRATTSELGLLRPCAYCGAKFAPTEPHLRNQRYCSTRCAREADRVAREVMLADQGLLGVHEIAQVMGLSFVRVQEHLADGAMRGQMLFCAGRPFWGVAEAEVVRFEREWVRGEHGDSGYRTQWLEPDRFIAWLQRTGALEKKARLLGITVTDAEAIERARVKKRARRLAARRRGRRPSPSAPARHERWSDRKVDLEAEIVERWEHSKDLLGEQAAGKRPSAAEIRRAVALEDWSEHPEDWARDTYPADRHDPETLDPRLYQAAEDRVRKGIKSLENAWNGIPAI